MKYIERVVNLVVQIFVNGAVIYGVFLLLSYVFYSQTPQHWYFNYLSVEPVSTPIAIGSGHILMESRLVVLQVGNLRWNDVLRCETDKNTFSYFSQMDTHADYVVTGGTNEEPIVSRWKYRGHIPQEPTTCRMYSTIKRDLPFGVTKVQVITSQDFDIK